MCHDKIIFNWKKHFYRHGFKKEWKNGQNHPTLMTLSIALMIIKPLKICYIFIILFISNIGLIMTFHDLAQCFFKGWKRIKNYIGWIFIILWTNEMLQILLSRLILFFFTKIISQSQTKFPSRFISSVNVYSFKEVIKNFSQTFCLLGNKSLMKFL